MDDKVKVLIEKMIEHLTVDEFATLLDAVVNGFFICSEADTFLCEQFKKRYPNESDQYFDIKNDKYE